MRLLRSRLVVAGVGAVVFILVATLLLVRATVPPVAARGSGRPPANGAAADAAHAPWYRLHTLSDHLQFTGNPTAAGPPNDSVTGILVDLDSNRIIWQKNPHAEVPPASTIKLLTTMVVLANYSPDKLITATPDALFAGSDETVMHIDPGEKLTVQELLTGLLMVSANDAANVLATDTVGMERFVGAMNAQAAALGLQDTHATSPVGLDDPDMHSSAYDLAVLAALDYKHWPLFRTIVDTQQTTLPASPLHGAFELTNVNLLLSIYPPAVGVKTGYTGNAGDCLIGMAVRDGHRLLSVLLGVPGLIFTESRQLLDWGFTQEGLTSQLPPPTPSPAKPPVAPAAAAAPTH